jgi:hypothetical protein
MRRAFVRAAVVVAHGERTGRDEDGLDLVDWSRHGAIIASEREGDAGAHVAGRVA